MNRIGFALRDEYADGYLGGVIAAGDTDLDVAAALDAGKGTIIVDVNDDPRLITALDERPELERVTVKDDAAATVSLNAVPLEERTVPELRDEAKARGIEGLASATKPELLAALEAPAADTEEA